MLLPALAVARILKDLLTGQSLVTFQDLRDWFISSPSLCKHNRLLEELGRQLVLSELELVLSHLEKEGNE